MTEQEREKEVSSQFPKIPEKILKKALDKTSKARFRGKDNPNLLTYE